MVLAMLLEIAYSYFLPQDTSKPLLVKAVLCFSPYSNIKEIAKTTDTNALGQIGCLNGMRQDLLISGLSFPISFKRFLPTGPFPWLGLSFAIRFSTRRADHPKIQDGSLMWAVFPPCMMWCFVKKNCKSKHNFIPNSYKEEIRQSMGMRSSQMGFTMWTRSSSWVDY